MIQVIGLLIGVYAISRLVQVPIESAVTTFPRTAWAAMISVGVLAIVSCIGIAILLLLMLALGQAGTSIGRLQ